MRLGDAVTLADLAPLCAPSGRPTARSLLRSGDRRMVRTEEARAYVEKFIAELPSGEMRDGKWHSFMPTVWPLNDLESLAIACRDHCVRTGKWPQLTVGAAT